MKKRLLSALLALVMVLAMLPATAFAADAGTSVTYHATLKTGTNIHYSGDPTVDNFTPGYYSGKGTEADPYVEVSSGFLAAAGNLNNSTGVMTRSTSGTVYSSIDDALAKSSNITLLSNSAVISTDKTTLTVDLNGHAANSISMTKGGTLRVGDSAASGTLNSAGTISISQSDDKSATGANVTLGYVSASLSVPTGRANTVNLFNAELTSALTMNGVGTVNSKATDTKQALKMTGISSKITGAVAVTGKSSTINVSNGTIDGNVTLTGLGSSITVDNLASVAAGTSQSIALTGSITATDKGVAPKVTVDNAFVGDITRATASDVGAPATSGDIVLRNTAHAGAITVDNGNVNISSSHTGNVTVKQGSLTVSGVENNGATLGNVELGETKATNMTVSGANVYIAKIAVASGGSIGVLNLSGVTNTYGELDLGSYNSNASNSGTGLMNGKVMTMVTNRNWLNGSVSYQIDVNGAAGAQGYIFAGPNDFQALVDNSTKATQWNQCNISHMGGEGTDNDRKFIQFSVDGKTVLSLLAKPGAVIKLPAEVSTFKTTDWVDGAGTHRPAGYSYVVTDNTTLSALEDYLDVTSITKVTADPAGIKAEVKNNGISLSGALQLTGGSGDAATITLTVETNDGTKNTVYVSYLYDEKTVQLTSVVGVAEKGNDKNAKPTVGIDAYTNQLTLQNGTKYSISGTGLKKMVDVDLVGAGTTTNKAQLEVGKVTVPGYNNDAAKKVLIDLIQGTTGGAANSTEVVFGNSPAVLEGLNSVVAAMSDSQINSWINSAQSTRFQENKKAGTEHASSLTNDMKPYENLTRVQVVAYLNMDVSIYNVGTTPGTMNVTLTPYYKVQVVDPNGTYDPVVVKAGAAIPSLGTNWGTGTSVKFNVGNDFNAPAAGGKAWAHQGSYVYEATINSNTISFANLNGFGGFIINGVSPKVTRYTDNTAATVVAYYDTLQAAVDQTENDQHLVVDSSYKMEAITLSGVARKFTVNTNGAGALSVTNATGVTVEQPAANSHTYTVQLTKDNVVVGTTADIAVASNVIGGTVTLSTTRAKANSTVDVTTTPAAGYLTSNLTATARTNKNTNVTVAVTRTSNNHYTFKVPEGATSITVTPTFAVDTGLPFSDISASDPYFEAVKYVYNRGMMNGRATANGTIFDGYTSISRAEVVTILYRLSGSPAASTYSGFTDVASNMYYAAPVAWARSNGIMNGYGSTFGPSDPITREQLAKVLRDYSVYRGLNVTKTTSLSGYPDAGSVHEWGQAGMQWAVGNGIINGVVNGSTTTLNPAGGAQRYHAATMLMRYCQSFGL